MNKFTILLSLLLLCVNQGKSQFQLGFMTDRPTQRTFNPDCKDQLDNCYSFSKEYCRAPYDQWAKDYCSNTCGFCIGPTTPALPCNDNLTNCDRYGTDVCTDLKYRPWANMNCRYTCRLCADGFMYTTTTLAPEKCADKVDCHRYGNTACSEQFKEWSHVNCPSYCGYCQGIPTPPPACTDKIPNCQGYEKVVCTNPMYQQWAEDNCRNYCGFCTVQPVISFGVTPPMPGRRDEQRAPSKKRQFSGSHHHNGVHVHPCWDQNNSQVPTDDPNCITTAPSIDVPPAVTTVGSGTTAAFPGSEFDPHPTAPKDWDYKDTVTEKKNTTAQNETTKPESGITSQITNVTVTPNGTQSAGGSTLSSLTLLPGITGSSVTLGVQNITHISGQSLSGSTPTIITVQGNATTSDGGTGTGISSSGQIGGLTNVISATTTLTGSSHQTTAPHVGGSTDGNTSTVSLSAGSHVTVVNTTRLSPIVTTESSETHTTHGSSSTSHGMPINTANTPAPTSSTTKIVPTTTLNTSTPVVTPSKLTTTPMTTEPTTAVEACKDRLENCRNYPIDTACHGIYEAWAKFNCPDHCGFCPKSTTLKPCLDKLSNCKEYDSGDLCTSQTYRLWSEDNCFAYCRFGHCGGKSGNVMLTTKPTTTPSTTTTEDPNCKDVSDRCVTITDQQCFGIYEAWARSHCAYRCGFCNTTCFDKNQNCDKYESEICTAQSYQGWARTNCRKFCNMCDPPTPPPTEFGKTRSTVTQQTPGHMTSPIPTFTVPTVNNH